MPTLVRGIDASSELTGHAGCLKSEGFDFAMRYYNTRDPMKNLSLCEARALVAAGLELGVVWEDGDPTSAQYFSRAKGVADGGAAYHMASNGIGQPAATPIYFAVDYDATESDVATAITAYFEGVRDAFSAAAGGAPTYEVGVYGSGLTCQTLLDAGLATFAWLSLSTGFRGSQAFAEKMGYNLRQFLFSKPVCGVGVDTNETNPNKPSGLFTI